MKTNEKITVEKNYISDTSWEWNSIIEEIKENKQKIMIINACVLGNEFLNFIEIEEWISNYGNFIDENNNLLENEEFETFYGIYENINQYLDELKWYLKNDNITLENLRKSYENWEITNWNYINYEEKMVELYNQLTESEIEFYNSRGYSQGDTMNIIYDEKEIDEKTIEYIDCLAWGKGYELTIKNGEDEDYITMYKEFANDEDIKEYVADNLGYDIKKLEVIENL